MIELIKSFLTVANGHKIGDGCSIPEEHKSVLDASKILCQKQFSLDKVEYSFGKGRAAKVPWISFLAYGQTTPSGIYPVLLYFKRHEKIVCAFGVSETNQPSSTWSNEVRSKYSLIKDRLGSKTSYGNSLVYAEYDSYNIQDALPKITKDIQTCIQIYHKHFEEKLELVRQKEDVRMNIIQFNQQNDDGRQFAKKLIQQSTYFVYDQGTASFAPGKFAGLKDMTLSRYQSLLDSADRSWKFDGYRTRKALESVLGTEFFSSSELNDKLHQWSAQFDAIVKENVQFCVVESPPEHQERPPIKAQKLSKPFMLLAGISGTGKTRFVREQATLTNPNGWLEDTYCLVSVRPDWHEPSDLLGYTTRLSGKAEYVVTDVLHFIVKAWKELLRCGIQVDGQTATGTKEQLDSVRPFWLCLDEMNLAPVEQYFADYLSILETREWEWSDTEFVYRCDPLLKATVFNDFFDEERFAVQNNLGLHDTEELWEFFQQNGIAIPPNLIVVGTVNMDETTHGFSRKVLDRALTIDFGEFYPNDFDAFLIPQTKQKIFSFPHFSNASTNQEFCSIDPRGDKSIAFLKAINAVLKETAFELAFRALNELLLSVQTHTVEDDKTLQAVWDDFLMSKVLPRIEGDLEKLAKVGSDKNLLELLQTVLETHLSEIWIGNNRPDLHRELINGEGILIECRSKRKLEWMMQRLDQFGFTTFWP